jgi:hypothetical protein
VFDAAYALSRAPHFLAICYTDRVKNGVTRNTAAFSPVRTPNFTSISPCSADVYFTGLVIAPVSFYLNVVSSSPCRSRFFCLPNLASVPVFGRAMCVLSLEAAVGQCHVHPVTDRLQLKQQSVSVMCILSLTDCN